MDSKRTILIADDAWENRAILAEIFKDEYTVIEAENGEEAFRILRECKEPVSVLLLDIVMPKMNGYELLEAMRKDAGLAEIPVIVISASDIFNNEITSLDLGAWDFISKPFNAGVIVQRVKNVISRNEIRLLNIENARLEEQAAALIKSQELTHQLSLVTSVNDICLFISEYTAKAKCLYIHENIFKLTGYSEAELKKITGGNIRNLIAEDDKAQALKQINDSLEATGEYAVDYKIRCKDGKILWVQDKGKLVSEGKRKYVYSALNDITKLKTAMEHLRYLAEQDELTGILNFSTFCARAHSLVKGNPDTDYIIVAWDVNRFKVVNNLYGYETGNKLLKLIAEKAKRYVGDSGVCCRVSGDRFAACVPRDSEGVKAIPDVFDKEIRDELGIDFKIVPSFGFCVVEDDDTPISSLYDRALIAKNTIKGNYLENYAYFDKSHMDKLLREQSIINDMNRALAEKEFQVYFQPQYFHDTGKIFGAEALVRWIHPEKGMISPGVFIPVFEKNGFITKLDEYVWNAACEWLSSWLFNNPESQLSVSVNISRVDILNSQLYETLTGIVEKYKVPPERFKLEVTESAYVDSPKHLIDVIKHLQEYGFIVEMDDFGSGYSSLNTLKDVPVDILKLDMKFLSGDDMYGRGGNILSAIVRMATWLGIPVIAEGVETKNHADYLLEVGCSRIQGYYYSKPLPISAFEVLLRTNEVESGRDEGGYLIQSDTNSFWDPENQMSLIFSSYVGAAAIYEYYKGNLETLRINDNFFEAIEVKREYFDKYKSHSFDIIHPDSIMESKRLINEAIATGKEQEMVSCWYRESTGHYDLWLKIKFRILSENQGHYLIYALLENVTEEVALRRRLNWEHERYRLVMDALNISTFDYNTVTDVMTYTIHERGEAPYEITVGNYMDFLPHSNVIHPDSVEPFGNMLRYASSGKVSGTIECFVRRDDNSEYVLKNVRYSSVADDNGKVYRVVARVDETSGGKW